MSLHAIKSSFLKVAGDSTGLGQVVLDEKLVVKDIHGVGKTIQRGSQSLKDWGNAQHQDLQDITDKYNDLITELGRSFENVSNKYHSARSRIKEIRKRHQDLLALEKQAKQLQEKLNSAIQHKKPYEHIQTALTQTKAAVTEREAAYAVFSRALLKEAMMIQFDAWEGLAVELGTISKYGRFLADQIPQGPVMPGQELAVFEGKKTTARIASDCLGEIKDVRNQRESYMTMSYTPMFSGSRSNPSLNKTSSGESYSGRNSMPLGDRRSTPLHPSPPATLFADISDRGYSSGPSPNSSVSSLHDLSHDPFIQDTHQRSDFNTLYSRIEVEVLDSYERYDTVPRGPEPVPSLPPSRPDVPVLNVNPIDSTPGRPSLSSPSRSSSPTTHQPKAPVPSLFSPNLPPRPLPSVPEMNNRMSVQDKFDPSTSPSIGHPDPEDEDYPVPELEMTEEDMRTRLAQLRNST